MKISAKMKKSIRRLTKKYGTFEINYGVEPIESNRVGRGFWDYAELHCPILKRDWVINHAGEIY